MVPTLETKISSPSAVIQIITDMQSEKNSEYFHDSSKELEKGGREYKESSSTQTSSSSSLLHKRKVHSYYVANGFYKSLSNHNMMVQNRPKKNVNSTTQRIISAKFLRVKQLQNELTEAQKTITDLQEENRTLKNIQKRQDSALRKYESQDSYLPQLLKSHEEEMRVLTQKYKKLRGSYNDLESRYNKQFTELTSVKERYRHLLQISQDKHLLQRERLTRQIEEMKIVINDLKNKIKLQSRRLDLEVKNYKYQLTAEFNKQKSLREQLKQSQDIVQKLQTALEDKERIMANCKMNQHVANKVNQSRQNKLPSSSLKPIRLRSTDDENREQSTVCIEKVKSENTLKQSKQNMNANSPDVIDKQSHESDTKSLGSNVHFSSSPELTTFSPLQGTIPNEIKRISDQITKESDNNNNMRTNLYEYTQRNLSSDVLKIDNYSVDSFEQYERAFQEETSSEKSEDFNAAAETVSWLELHEKIIGKTETDLEDTPKDMENVDHTNETELKSPVTFNHDEDRTSNLANEVNVDNYFIENDELRTPRDQRVQVLYSVPESHQSSKDSLPIEKKSALLEALKQIDSEVQSEGSLHENNVTIKKQVIDSRVRKSKRN